MALTHVQGASAAEAGSDTNIAVTLNGITAGNLLAVFIKWEGGATTCTVSDGTTEFDTTPAIVTHANGDVSCCFRFLLVANGGNKTITATFGAARVYKRIIVSEFSYSGTCSYDAGNTGSGTGTTVNSGNITTVGTDEVAIGGFGEYFGTTTTSEQINGVAATEPAYSPATYASIWYRILTETFSNGAATATVTSSAWVSAIVSFSVAAGGGGDDLATKNILNSRFGIISVSGG